MTMTTTTTTTTMMMMVMIINPWAVLTLRDCNIVSRFLTPSAFFSL